jgi:hypothetical protein
MTSASAQPPPSVAVDWRQFLDWVNLMYHLEIAKRLLANPESVLNRARSNVERWTPVHAGTFSAHALEEWRILLDTKSVPELVAIVTEDSDEGQRLRQSTPFTGILSEEEQEEFWRRYALRAMTTTSAKPVPPVPIDSQQFIDLVALEYHKEIAALLMMDPDRVIEEARDNLRRWLLAYERGTREAWCLEEWEQILDRHTMPELIAIITEDSDEGQRLRSSTPFVGLLSAEERKEIWRRCEKMAVF